MTLPSDDIEISASNKSVQWQFDVNQDTNRSSQVAESDRGADFKQSISDQQSKISSDLNSREEIDDLQSCPEDIGKSTSLSNMDLDLNVDHMTDELLNILLE